METTNKSGKEEIPSRTEAFVTFEKGLGWFEMEKECNPTQFFALKQLYDLATEKILEETIN